ncbi:MAG TPA: class I SAM-dependent methyltransferase [Telluria sp.]
MSNPQVTEYYAKIAADVERGYQDPERQDDLEQMRAQLANVLRGHVVLEVGCGSGYWTEVIAASADSVLATDINPAMIELAQERALPQNVRLRITDAQELPADIGDFTAVFMGLWWSHMRRDEQDRFVAHLRARLGKDVMLVILDEDYVEGSSVTVARTDLEGNTYQILTTPDGQRYELPKGYPSDSALRKRLGPAVREIKIARTEFYWLLTCRLK